MPDEMRQHEAVVQLRAPAHERALVRLAPEPRDQRAQQQLLRQAHARSAGGISNARNSTQAQPARALSGRVQLVDADLGAVRVAGDVDEQVAEQRGPPATAAALRLRPGARDLRAARSPARTAVVPRFVDARRLAGRPDEQAREQVRQRRMVAASSAAGSQQIRPAQERAVGRRRAAEHDVVAAAGAGVAAVDHELLGAEPRLAARPRRGLGVVAPARARSRAGWMLTSITPGSGVTLSALRRGSRGGG